jgi:hypothetical protein
MKTKKCPNWVKQEIRRLEEASYAGGSGSAAVFNSQIAALRVKYSFWGPVQVCIVKEKEFQSDSQFQSA